MEQWIESNSESLYGAEKHGAVCNVYNNFGMLNAWRRRHKASWVWRCIRLSPIYFKDLDFQHLPILQRSNLRVDYTKAMNSTISLQLNGSWLMSSQFWWFNSKPILPATLFTVCKSCNTPPQILQECQHPNRMLKTQTSVEAWDHVEGLCIQMLYIWIYTLMS